MNTEIYIFANAVSRKNGGSSSIVDLSNTLAEIGYKVEVISPFGFMDKYIYKASNVNKKLSISTLNKSIFKDLKVSNIKKTVNKILNFISFYKDISLENSIVIDAIGLPSDYIEKLKSNNCKIILNHAGSPNAYIKYFGLNGGKREDLDNSRNEYLKMINTYSYILFQSQTQANTLKYLAKWNVDKTLVLKPSVSEDDINKVKKNKSILSTKDFNVVVVGSVQMRKGQHLLPTISYKIAKKIDNVKFHIVGNIVDENYMKDIEELSLNLHQEKKIICHGFKENYLGYMNSADVILQVSEEEGVSRILREAMALKKVIISFKLDGTNDLLVNNEDSLLSEYGNLEEITENIIQVYKDKILYTQLSTSALKNFEEKYSLKQYKIQLENIIKKIKE